ncbi:MAG: hypothetical protein GF320_13415 [Armatimonadia bacterium]|nr:hypothetical protein [Armatimonadia bacterium]
MFWTALLAAILILTLAAGAGAQPLDIADFGATPDDGEDDTAAFLEALEEVSRSGGGGVKLHPGRYDLTAGANPESPRLLFPIADLEGFVIDGGGAELMIHGPNSLFHFSRCSDVTLRDFSIDQARAPFSQGMVIAAEATSFDVRVDEEFPVSGGEGIGAFMNYDPETRLPATGGLDIYHSVTETELIADQTLRIHLNREIAVPVGDMVVLRHWVYGHNAIVFDRCTNVLVEDVTVYATPGMALIGMVCEDVTLNRFDVIPTPGTGRIMSATADATHFGGCKGTVTLTDCTFEGMGDDGANVKSGLYLTVLEQVDERTILGQHNLQLTDLPDPGDTMELIHRDTLITFDSAVVAAASMEEGEGNIHRVEFEEPLPEGLGEGDLLGNATRTPRLRMTGCTVRRNRARGVLCQTRDAIIEDCTFERCTSAGVLVMTEAIHFFESIGTRDVTVRNCRFIECNYGAASGEGAIQAFAWLGDWEYPPQPGVHRNVTFEGNLISGTEQAGIFASGVDGLVIRGNTIEDACRNPLSEIGRAAIHVMSSEDVVIEDNEVDPAAQGEGCEWPVQVVDE